MDKMEIRNKAAKMIEEYGWYGGYNPASSKNAQAVCLVLSLCSALAEQSQSNYWARELKREILTDIAKEQNIELDDEIWSNRPFYDWNDQVGKEKVLRALRNK